MTLWWRAYTDAINHPKLLRLSDAMHRAWFTLQCIAAANSGTLPPAADIALTLRLKPSKVAEWITVLTKAELLDNRNGVFSPHNWDSRQFKSDGSTERVKRYREREETKKRNVSETLPETGPEAEQSQNRAEAEQTRAAVSKSEKVLRTDLMEIFGASKCPDLSRAGVWLSKGYAPAMITEIVRELLARKPDISSLAYFDAKLAERHANRAETPSERAAAEATYDFDWALGHFAKGGHWPRKAGPEPGQIGCRAPPELLAKHGLGLDGFKLKKVDA